jgi:hypothetical protein
MVTFTINRKFNLKTNTNTENLMALHFCIYNIHYILPHVRVGVGSDLLQLSDMPDF